jgi:hypothetical protein
MVQTAPWPDTLNPHGPPGTGGAGVQAPFAKWNTARKSLKSGTTAGKKRWSRVQEAIGTATTSASMSHSFLRNGSFAMGRL